MTKDAIHPGPKDGAFWYVFAEWTESMTVNKQTQFRKEDKS